MVLQKIASYFAFKYNTDVIINSARSFFVEEDCDVVVDTAQLFSSFNILNNFFSKIRNDFNYMSRAAHRAVVKK